MKKYQRQRRRRDKRYSSSSNTLHLQQDKNYETLVAGDDFRAVSCVKPYLQDQLVSFSALRLLVWLYYL